MTYNDHLNNLFNQWIERSENNNEPRTPDGKEIVFTRDGLVEKNDSSINVQDDWDKSDKRIMFLLKDQPTEWCDDLRLWLKDLDDADEKTRERKANNRNIKSRFLHNIANLFYGLNNASKSNDCRLKSLKVEAVKELFNTKPFALVECKKQGGTTSISNNQLKLYLERYGDLLWEEIQILKPNMLVCTNANIYAFILEKFGNDNLKTIEGHNSIRIAPDGTLILCSFHPSIRKGYEYFYESVMDHYRACLNSL